MSGENRDSRHFRHDDENQNFLTCSEWHVMSTPPSIHGNNFNGRLCWSLALILRIVLLFYHTVIIIVWQFILAYNNVERQIDQWCNELIQRIAILQKLRIWYIHNTEKQCQSLLLGVRHRIATANGVRDKLLNSLVILIWTDTIRFHSFTEF